MLGAALFAALQTAPGLAWRPALGPLYARWFATLVAVWLVSGVLFDVYHLPRVAHRAVAAHHYGGEGAGRHRLRADAVADAAAELAQPAARLCGAGGGGAGGLAVALRQGAGPAVVQAAGAHRGQTMRGTAWCRPMQQATGDAPNPIGAAATISWVLWMTTRRCSSGRWGLAVLGDYTALLDLAQVHGVDEIIVAITNRHAIAPATFQAGCVMPKHGYRVTTMAGLY